MRASAQNRFFKFPNGNKLHVPNPTWGNHLPIMRDSGVEPTYYSYDLPCIPHIVNDLRDFLHVL